MKKVLIFFSMLLLASNNFAEENLMTENITENSQQPIEQKKQKIVIDVKSVYDSLNIKNKIDYSIFQKAYLGYVQISHKNPGVLIIIDYTKPSNEERFYVLDLNKKKLVYSTRVAHSKNSGLEIPLEFSDDPNSYQSSLGFFVTLGEYNGAYGYSLRLKGLEENINANAEDRAIVIHGGDIVEDEYIKKFGFAGRSLGCPVLPNSLTREIIDFIKHGRVLFIYGNDEEYIDESTYLSKLASVFEGSPKNIVEIEKLVEVQKTSPTPTTTVVATTTVPTTVVSDNKKDNTNREVAIAEANITKIFEIIKQEYKYTSSVDNNKIAYTRLLKDVIQEKLNKTPEIKEGSENKKLNDENINNQEKAVEQTVTTDNTLETKDKTVVPQQNENVQENKKEERKYPEEVTKKSLGIGIKFKGCLSNSVDKKV
ncbi:murein L,D-transpeptidase catalytic domain family protein [Fusobacterium nucleatum]|nr:murein L,D-transpeptidase catalytic domain family protein [Fusobacterium polymorphum]